MPIATRRLLAAGVVAVIAIVAAAVFVAIPAYAQTGRTAVCTGRGSIAAPAGDGPQQLQVWMNQQLAKGKTQFIVADKDVVLCAW